jgi:hypothetical protein
MDNSCTLSFRNAVWIQDGNYSFTVGRMEVMGNVNMLGRYSFEYASMKPFRIVYDTHLSFDCDMSFSYNPPIANRDLITMDNRSSVLWLNGASVATSSTGLRLTKGTLIIANKTPFYNDTGVSLSDGFSLGDGIIASNDLNIEIMPGASIELMSGNLTYANVN